jgi:drug/metabolite transporter (DMT)-like permease
VKATALARFHVIVFIWGFTAILGKLISLQAIDLVWYRVLFTIISLWVYFRFIRFKLQLPPKAIIWILFIGLIVGFHWYCFYHSIKVSNVSITLISLSTITLFTSLLEPLFFKRAISLKEVFLALVVIIGISLIFRFESGYSEGIFYGILAALAGSLFVVLNGKIANRFPAYSITFYEIGGALILLTCMMLIDGDIGLPSVPSATDFWLLVILSIVCTAIPFVVSVHLMKELTPFTVNMITNLEPVYGILLSLLVFGDDEYMSPGFYAGTFLILFAIFTYLFLKKRNKI